MNRIEYKNHVRETFHDKPAWTAIVNQKTLSFPELINVVALELFYLKDLNSPLAIETHRRYSQLRETGITDT